MGRMSGEMEAEKARASAWFRSLRDEIVTAFEGAGGQRRRGRGSAPGRFEVTQTRRADDGGGDAGGGLMSVMRGGRVFEKVGVNVSTVHGGSAARAQSAMAARGVPGMETDPRFWASGISLVAHMQNPHAPAVHMNTRMFWTPHAWWFGGGADLNPCIEYPEDTAAFPRHAGGSLRRARSRLLSPLQVLGGRVFLRAPPGPRAGRRRHLLRRSQHRRLGGAILPLPRR